MIFQGSYRLVAALGLTMSIWFGGSAFALTFDRNPERWGFGADLGLWGGTVDGNLRPALAGNVDYYLDRAFSVGPMVLLSPSGDLTEFALAGVGRYHYRTQIGNIVPFIGLGIIHASWEDQSSTSYYIPIGLSLEYQLTKKLAVSATGILNLHHLFPDTPDNKSGTMLIGLRYGGPSSRSRRFGFAP